MAVRIAHRFAVELGAEAVMGVVALVLLAGVFTSPPMRAALVRKVRGAQQRRAALRRAALMGDYCHAVGRRLHAGETLVQALAVGTTFGALAAPVTRLLEEHAQGATVERAAQRWADRDGTPEVTLLAVAVGLAAERVGHQPVVFERVASSVRARTSLAAEVRAQAAGAMASMWVVAALPWVVAGLLFAEGGAAVDVLLRSPLGWFCLAAAVALEVMGVAWMLLLIRRAVPAAGAAQ